MLVAVVRSGDPMPTRSASIAYCFTPHERKEGRPGGEIRRWCGVPSPLHPCLFSPSSILSQPRGTFTVFRVSTQDDEIADLTAVPHDRSCLGPRGPLHHTYIMMRRDSLDRQESDENNNKRRRISQLSSSESSCSSSQKSWSLRET